MDTGWSDILRRDSGDRTQVTIHGSFLPLWFVAWTGVFGAPCGGHSNRHRRLRYPTGIWTQSTRVVLEIREFVGEFYPVALTLPFGLCAVWLGKLVVL